MKKGDLVVVELEDGGQQHGIVTSTFPQPQGLGTVHRVFLKDDQREVSCLAYGGRPVVRHPHDDEYTDEALDWLTEYELDQTITHKDIL